MTLSRFSKALFGKGFELLFPSLVREIDTDINRSNRIRIKRIIVSGRVMRSRRRGDAALQAALTEFWRAPSGDEYHLHHSGDVHAMFRERHGSLLTDFQRAATRAGQSFSRLVEIGCGVGRLLVDCRTACPKIGRFIGLDLNPYAIATARSETPHMANLHFEQAEAVSWLEAHPECGTVLVSYNGVMEYLSRDAVSRMFDGLARSGPAAVLLCEPVARAHDLDADIGSFPFGSEQSFSHNHPALLRQAGFRIITAREDFHEASETRLILIVAMTGE